MHAAEGPIGIWPPRLRVETLQTGSCVTQAVKLSWESSARSGRAAGQKPR